MAAYRPDTNRTAQTARNPRTVLCVDSPSGDAAWLHST
jgi:hypothetical protein